MARQIFVNIPVKNLNKSVEFFTALGFTFNPQFTDENATCMIVADNIFVMLLVEPFYKGFTKKEIPDTSKFSEVILSLSSESREDVDKMINNVIKAGGKSPNPPADHGWMYNRSFEDLDGHIWEVAFLDASAFPQ